VHAVPGYAVNIKGLIIELHETFSKVWLCAQDLLNTQIELTAKLSKYSALDQAANLDFDRFIPSHFDSGDKSCVTGTRDFFNDSRQAVLAGLDKHGWLNEEDVGKWFRSVTGDTRSALDDKYGHWHGYDEMILPHMLRQVSGSYLGF